MRLDPISIGYVRRDSTSNNHQAVGSVSTPLDVTNA